MEKGIDKSAIKIYLINCFYCKNLDKSLFLG